MKLSTGSLIFLTVIGLTGCGAKDSSNSEFSQQLQSMNKGADVKSGAHLKVPDEVTLLSRVRAPGASDAELTEAYTQATYSFRYLTRDDVETTRNNWELLFEARYEGESSEDTFGVNTVVDDLSVIYDLGERSCKSIHAGQYEEYRHKSPMTWFGYSDVDLRTLKPAHDTPVRVGHCYLVVSNDSDGRVIALFHVKSHVPRKSVTINQIKVLDVITSPTWQRPSPPLEVQPSAQTGSLPSAR